MYSAAELHNLMIVAEMCRRRLADEGIRLRPISSMADYEASLARVGKLENHRVISTLHHDLASADAIGLLFEKDGALVGGVASRLLRLGRDTLSDHWRQTAARLYGGGRKEMIGRIVSAAESITGDVVYEGELFLAEAFRGKRVNLTAIMYYLHILSVLHWRPSWLFGFIRLEHHSRVMKYGFTGAYVGAQEWLAPGDRRSGDECLVTLRPADLHDAAQYYISKPENFAPPARSEKSS